MSITIGIDLGSATTKAAYLGPAGPELIENRAGHFLTPSVVYLAKNSSLLVGESARDAGLDDPINLAFLIKQFLGRDFTDPLLQPVIHNLPFPVVRADNAECEFLLRGERRRPADLAAALLRQVKGDAESYLGEQVSQAVLAVPGYFGMRQRQALLEAARQAGLEVKLSLSEAAAVTLAAGLDAPEEPRTVLVVDYGGHVFNAAVLFTCAGILEELGAAGDANLGGDLFDQKIQAWLLDKLRHERGVDIRHLPNAPELQYRIRHSAELAKINLCRTGKPASILIPGLLADIRLSDFEARLTPDEFEQMIQEDIQHSTTLVQDAIRRAKLSVEDIDAVYLVGGNSKVPLVQKRLGDMFGEGRIKKPNSFGSIALGAAIQAGNLVAPQALSYQTVSGIAGSDDQAGGPVQVLEKIPKPIGFEQAGGSFAVLLDEATYYPMDKPVTRTFYTVQDRQPFFRLPLFEGFDPLARNNQYLGTVEYNLPPGLPAGTAITAEFLVDGDGVISVAVAFPEHPEVKATARLISHAAGDPGNQPASQAGASSEPQVQSQGKPSPEQVLASETQFLIFQCLLVLREGQGLLPASGFDKIQSLVRSLSDALQDETWNLVKSLSAQVESELEVYRLFLTLGIAREIANNAEFVGSANRNSVTKLNQALKLADAALPRKDENGLWRAVNDASSALNDILQSQGSLLAASSFIGAPSLMGGGGGQPGHAYEPVNMYYGPPSTLPMGHAQILSSAAPEPAAKPAPPPSSLVPGAVDRVHFSVTAPPRVQDGSSFVVDLWAHLEQQRQEVIQRAREAAGGREIQVKTKGPLPVQRGTVLTVHLKIDGMVIEDPEDTILWQGEIGSANFAVHVPTGTSLGIHLGRATIYADAAPIAKINFELEVGQRIAEVKPLPVQETRYQNAFASYASADRDKVLHCLLGMEKAAPQLQIFVDVHSLRSGQNWEQELWTRIPASDIFFLFWSTNASQSTWVEKEWRCAYNAKGLEFINPVPLQPPDLAPPPPELAGLHFNDWELAYLRSSKP